MIALLLACTEPPPPPELPDLLLVRARIPAERLAQALPESREWPLHAASLDAARTDASLVTGQWGLGSAAPSTLPAVLQLYGYLGLGTLPVDAPFELGAEAAGPCGVQADETSTKALLAHPEQPWLLVLDADHRCAPAELVAALEPWMEDTRRRRRVFLALWPSDAQGWEAGTGRLLELDGSGKGGPASSVDLLPTLFTAAGAVVPSDASGQVLGQSEDLERPVFQVTPERQASVLTARNRLVVRVPEEGLGELPPEDAELLDASGAPVEDPEALARLYPVLRGWLLSESSTVPSERMGSEAFSEMLKDNGYW